MVNVIRLATGGTFPVSGQASGKATGKSGGTRKYDPTIARAKAAQDLADAATRQAQAEAARSAADAQVQAAKAQADLAAAQARGQDSANRVSEAKAADASRAEQARQAAVEARRKFDNSPEGAAVNYGAKLAAPLLVGSVAGYALSHGVSKLQAAARDVRIGQFETIAKQARALNKLRKITGTTQIDRALQVVNYANDLAGRDGKFGYVTNGSSKTIRAQAERLGSGLFAKRGGKSGFLIGLAALAVGGAQRVGIAATATEDNQNDLVRTGIEVEGNFTAALGAGFLKDYSVQVTKPVARASAESAVEIEALTSKITREIAEAKVGKGGLFGSLRSGTPPPQPPIKTRNVKPPSIENETGTPESDVVRAQRGAKTTLAGRVKKLEEAVYTKKSRAARVKGPSGSGASSVKIEVPAAAPSRLEAALAQVEARRTAKIATAAVSDLNHISLNDSKVIAEALAKSASGSTVKIGETLVARATEGAAGEAVLARIERTVEKIGAKKLGLIASVGALLGIGVATTGSANASVKDKALEILDAVDPTNITGEGGLLKELRGGNASPIRDLAHQQAIDRKLQEVPSETIARQAALGLMDPGQAAFGAAVAKNGGLDSFYQFEGPPTEISKRDYAMALGGEGVREAGGNTAAQPEIAQVTSTPRRHGPPGWVMPMAAGSPTTSFRRPRKPRPRPSGGSDGP